ncbi:MAG TPA: signal peptidase I [Verrucomicrobiae bacterium]
MNNSIQQPPNPLSATLYPASVGALISVLIPGAGHFASGRRLAAVGWFCLFAIYPLLTFYFLTAPWASGLVLGVAVGTAGCFLWLFMIVRASRPCGPFSTGGWVGLSMGCVLLVVAQLVLTRIMFRPYRIPTGGMEPTLMGDHVDMSKLQQGGARVITNRGDGVLVQRFAYWFAKPKRGDLVVFATAGIQHPNVAQDQIYIKRVVGVPGDKISIKDGRLCNHGVPVEDEFFKNTRYTLAGVYLRSEADEFEVPQAAYFVMGDNSRSSLDSRYWGPVPAKNLRGRATRIYWPPSRILSL